jgi:hypothetical protein
MNHARLDKIPSNYFNDDGALLSRLGNNQNAAEREIWACLCVRFQPFFVPLVWVLDISHPISLPLSALLLGLVLREIDVKSV